MNIMDRIRNLGIRGILCFIFGLTITEGMRSDRSCKIIVNHRIPCISWHNSNYLTQAQCFGFGCCYHFTWFASPTCYRGNYEETTTTTTTTTTASTTTAKPTTTTPQTKNQVTADPLLIAFLTHLSQQGHSSHIKDDVNDISRFGNSGSEVDNLQTFISGPHPDSAVSEEPAQRSVDRSIHQVDGKNYTIRETCEFNSDHRDDCGFPGITGRECKLAGCCWDSSQISKYWCFYVNVEYVEVGSPDDLVDDYDQLDLITPPIEEEILQLNYIIDGPIHRNNLETNELDDELMVEPPTPPSMTNQNEATTEMLSDDKLEFENETTFLAFVEQELSGLGSNSDIASPVNVTTTTLINANLTTSPIVLSTTTAVTTASTTTNSSPVTEPRWLQDLLNRQSTDPTTITTTTTQKPEVRNTNRNNQDLESPNLGASQSVSGQVEKDLTQIAAFLKLLDDLEKQQTRLSNQQNQCVLNNADACCRLDPTAPCCEFQFHLDISHRSAPTSRIVGGGPAGELRSAMAYLTKGVHREPFCGGTLIMHGWVITAAHCVLEYCHGLSPTSTLKVIMGKYRRSPYFKDPGQQEILASNVICHPNHCKSAGQPRLNDMALIKLSRDVVVSSVVLPASLPSSFEAPEENQDCIALGWGSTKGTGFDDVLKEVHVPLVSNSQCNRPDWRNCVIRACMMCAGGANADPCDGDSGGPLFCQRPSGLYVLHGIFSWGRCGAEARKPAVYTRASYFMNWVYRVTQSFNKR